MVVCGNQNCQLRGSKFCNRDFTMLNQFGQCKVWFFDNGQMRPQPWYPIIEEVQPQPEPQEEIEQETSPEEKIGVETKEENSDNIAENTN